MPLADRPTAGYIAALRTHLMKVWDSTWNDWEKRDSYYYQTFALWPENIKRSSYHPGRSRSVVDSAVHQQVSFEPRPHRFPAGEGETHKKRADSVENYLRAVFAETALLQNVLTFQAAGKNLIHLGYTVVEGPLLSYRDRPKKPQRRGRESTEPPLLIGEAEVAERNRLADDYEARLTQWENEKKTWMPFTIRTPHPSEVLLDPEEKRPPFAIKHALRYSHQLYDITYRRRNRRAVEVWKVGENPFALIMCDEFWTPEWHAMMPVGGEGGTYQGTIASDQMLFVERNSMGYVPFDHAFSGWGQLPTRNDQREPLHLAAGILTGVMESLRIEAQAMTGQHNALVEAAYDPVYTSGDPAELAAQLARGDIVRAADKSTIWRLAAPNLPTWLADSLSALANDIEQGTMSRSLSGLRQVGESTVGATAIHDTAASRKFVGINKQLEYLATNLGSKILRLVDQLGETLYCRGYTIKPSDIEHDYSVQVTFQLVDPVLSLQERALGLREWQAGAKSLETLWSADMRLEDATGERDRLLEDYVRRHPLVIELMASKVAEGMGLGDLLERALAAQAALKGGSNGNPPAPAGILGPDGLPLLGGTMGRPPIDGSAESVLRQPLTPDVVKPSRVGQNLAGG